MDEASAALSSYGGDAALYDSTTCIVEAIATSDSLSITCDVASDD